MSNKNVFVVLVIIILIGAGVFLWYQNNHKTTQPPATNSNSKDNSSQTQKNYSFGGKLISNNLGSLVVQSTKTDTSGLKTAVLYNVTTDAQTTVNKVSLSTHKTAQIRTSDIPNNADVVVFTNTQPTTNAPVYSNRVDYTTP